MMKERPFEPQDRWVDDAVRILSLPEALPETKELIAILFSSIKTAGGRDGLGQPGYWIFIRSTAPEGATLSERRL